MGRPKRSKLVITSPRLLEDRKRQFLEIVARVCPEVLESLRAEVLEGGLTESEWCRRFGLDQTWIESSVSRTVELWRSNPSTLHARATAKDVEKAVAQVRLQLADKPEIDENSIRAHVEGQIARAATLPQQAFIFQPAAQQKRELFRFELTCDPCGPQGYETLEDFTRDIQNELKKKLEAYIQSMKDAGLVYEADQIENLDLKMKATALYYFQQMTPADIRSEVGSAKGIDLGTANAWVKEISNLLGLTMRGPGRPTKVEDAQRKYLQADGSRRKTNTHTTSSRPSSEGTAGSGTAGSGTPSVGTTAEPRPSRVYVIEDIPCELVGRAETQAARDVVRQALFGAGLQLTSVLDYWARVEAGEVKLSANDRETLRAALRAKVLRQVDLDWLQNTLLPAEVKWPPYVR